MRAPLASLLSLAFLGCSSPPASDVPAGAAVPDRDDEVNQLRVLRVHPTG